MSDAVRFSQADQVIIWACLAISAGACGPDERPMLDAIEAALTKIDADRRSAATSPILDLVLAAKLYLSDCRARRNEEARTSRLNLRRVSIEFARSRAAVQWQRMTDGN